MKKSLLLFLFTSLTLISCSNDNSEDSTNTLLPKEIISESASGSGTATEKFYYENRKILRTEGFSSLGFSKTLYTYEGDLIISELYYSKVNAEDPFVLKNEKLFTYYPDGKLKSALENTTHMSTINKIDLEYEGNLIRCYNSYKSKIGSVPTDFQPYYRQDITINNGTTASMKQYYYDQHLSIYNTEPELETEYYYDNKNSITKNIIGYNALRDPFIDHNSLNNNATGFRSTYSSGTVDNYPNQFTYEYNAANYPITKYFHESNGDIQYTFHISYY